MFIFYDTETSGTNVDFDQILQFAAVLTDHEFTVLDEINLKCRCLPWVVPSPGALAITNTHPDALSDSGLPTLFEMMAAVRSTLERWSPATFIGYNSMRFDEPLLQRAFWQSLCPPYLTVSNGNNRLDLLPIMRAISASLESPIKFPRNNLGTRTFRLDALAPANNFEHTNAHDAFTDVKATIHLAKAISKFHSQLWKALSGRAAKSETTSALFKSNVVLLVDGTKNSSPTWWATLVDHSDAQPTHALLVRLSVNWRELATSDSGQFESAIIASPKPIRRLALNKAPFFLTVDEANKILNVSPSAAELEQADFLRVDRKITERIVAIYQSNMPAWSPSVHIEQQIFDGFPNDADRALMDKFLSAPDHEKVRLIPKFHDNRFQQLAKRIVFTIAPASLSAAQLSRMREAIAERILFDHDDKNLWRTIPSALRELRSLDQNLLPPNLRSEIESWLFSTRKNYSKYCP